MTASQSTTDRSSYLRPSEPLPGQGLTWVRAIDHPELLAPRTFTALKTWHDGVPQVADLIHVAAINPAVSDTAAMSDEYRIDMHLSVNCVLVAGKREGKERNAAVAVRASRRADINGAIRRMLAVRKASFVPVDRAVQDSEMEYGGITPLGLGAEWPVLLDLDIAHDPSWIVLGSGVRRSKLALPGTTLAALSGTHCVAGIALA
ncbi:Cys-tRNA(Pro) deacylase, prolyl-tRNA editing enzyme YbaK/EbsC [Micrococcales bacterium KH10]|nr:Cys-tRNA(Pro) deacylase, prolyl-tRNA editing enzyme YbaK/EbsC [Micrococcales bacterium KH10]